MPATRAIVGIIFVLHVAGVLWPDLQRLLLEHGAQSPAMIDAGQWYRLITSSFLHSHDGSNVLTHALGNMFWLWIAGSQLEPQTGSGGFVALYLAGAVAGGAAAHAVGHGGVGASDAVYALLGVCAVVAVTAPGGRQQLKGWLLLLGYGLSMPLWVPDGESIGWAAHLGGLAAGLLIGVLWRLITQRTAEVTLPPVVPATVATLSLVLVMTGVVSGGPMVGAISPDVGELATFSDPGWSVDERASRLRAAFGADMITTKPSPDTPAITIDPQTFGVFEGGGLDDHAESLEVHTRQTRSARRALQAAGYRWYLVDEVGREWTSIEELEAEQGNAMPWTTPFVGDIETTDGGLIISVDLEGSAAPPPMQEAYLRVLLDEFTKAGVTAAHVRPGPS